MKKISSDKNNIKFIKIENDFNKLLENIKTFGTVYDYPSSQIIKIEDFNKINKWIGGCNIFILRYSKNR